MGQANSSPDDSSRCPFPATIAEQDAVVRAGSQLTRDSCWAETPEADWTISTGPMLGKRISGPVSLRRQARPFSADYVRCSQPTAAEQAATHKRNQAIRRDRQRRKDLAPEAYRESSKLDETCSTSDALRSQLAELGASTTSCVFVDEVSKEQAKAANKYGRFSMYADSRGRHVAEIFTDDEFDSLVPDEFDSLVPDDGDEEERGRDMPVFDRAGRRYDFEFTYSEELGYYRLTAVGAEYERFMVDNNVVHDVLELGKKMTMQVFAFRSPKLLPEDKGFQDHQDGALGVVILFSESEEDEYAEWIELDDDSMTVKEMVEHIQQNQKAAH